MKNACKIVCMAEQMENNLSALNVNWSTVHPGSSHRRDNKQYQFNMYMHMQNQISGRYIKEERSASH